MRAGEDLVRGLGVAVGFGECMRIGVEVGVSNGGCMLTFEREFVAAGAELTPTGVSESASLPLTRSMTTSEEGDSDGFVLVLVGLSGVRKGDLKGLWSVLEASFRRRRFERGVDIIGSIQALMQRSIEVEKIVSCWML